MSNQERIFEVYHEASMGNVEACAFLYAFHAWAHLIDDLVDEPDMDRLATVDVGMKANVMFSSPFYQAHAHVLSVTTAVIADAYAWSVRCERKGGDIAKLAESLRLAGNQMILAIAMIMGGWEHMQRVSAKLWPLVFDNQLSIRI